MQVKWNEKLTHIHQLGATDFWSVSLTNLIKKSGRGDTNSRLRSYITTTNTITSLLLLLLPQIFSYLLLLLLT